MNLFLVHNMRGVVLISLFLLASAQRTSNSLKDVDFQELARQNRITKQILEAYLQKKLGRGSVKPPSISDILPVKKREDVAEKEEGEAPLEQDYVEDDSLQSVESEQIDSIYANEGRSKKYLNPAFESDVETNSIRIQKKTSQNVIR